MPYLNLFLCIENVASGGMWVGREGGHAASKQRVDTSVYDPRIEWQVVDVHYTWTRGMWGMLRVCWLIILYVLCLCVCIVWVWCALQILNQRFISLVRVLGYLLLLLQFWFWISSSPVTRITIRPCTFWIRKIKIK